MDLAKHKADYQHRQNLQRCPFYSHGKKAGYHHDSPNDERLNLMGFPIEVYLQTFAYKFSEGSIVLYCDIELKPKA